jgi:hypothetical protein
MTIVFACPCGNTLRTTEYNVGRMMRCPVCNQQVMVPARNTPTNPIAAKSVSQEKTRRRNRFWTLATPVFAMVAIMALAAACFLNARTKPETETPHLDLIPRDALAFATLRVADIWHDLQHGTPDKHLSNFEHRIREATALSPEEIERLTYVLLDEKQDSPLIIVTSKDYLRVDDVSTQLIRNGEERQYEKVSYLLSPAGGASFSVHDRHSYVFGKEASVKEWITRRQTSQDAGALEDALQRARQGGDHVVAAVSMSSGLKQYLEKVDPISDPITGMRSCLLTASVLSKQTGSTALGESPAVRYEFRATYQTGDDALRAAQGLTKWKMGLTELVGTMLLQAVAAIPEKAAKDVQASLAALKLQQESKVLGASGQLDAATLFELIAKFQRLRNLPSRFNAPPP